MSPLGQLTSLRMGQSLEFVGGDCKVLRHFGNMGSSKGISASVIVAVILHSTLDWGCQFVSIYMPINNISALDIAQNVHCLLAS